MIFLGPLLESIVDNLAHQLFNSVFLSESFLFCLGCLLACFVEPLGEVLHKLFFFALFRFMLSSEFRVFFQPSLKFLLLFTLFSVLLSKPDVLFNSVFQLTFICLFLLIYFPCCSS